MFFYTSLFVACAIAALLAIYLYKAITNVGKALYKGLLPSTKTTAADHLSRTRYYSTKNSAPAPWGWKGGNNTIREHGPKAAVTTGFSGFDAFVNDHSKQFTSAGWLNREEKTEIAGSSYKVSRKAGTARTSRKSGRKPWGW